MLMDDLRLFLTYTAESVDVSTGGRINLFSGGSRTPIASGSLANLLRSGVTSSTRISIAHDTRDNRLFTRSGWFSTASAEFAESFLLSQNRFTRYELTSRYFYPLWGPFVLRLKGDVGLVTSRDPQGVPISERYFVGGIFDIRGFSPRSLGPQIRAPNQQAPDSNLTNFRVGGNMQVVGKAEIEFPIIEKVGIRAVVFTDAGNAFNLEDQYCRLKPAMVDISANPCVSVFPLSSMRTSWGFGFRWFSPIGPLRFEWGLPFKPLLGEQPMIFEFTIGNDL
jgi:outer membrane protein insertion porin family